MSEDNINMSAVAAVASSDHQVSSKTWGNYVIKGLVQPRWSDERYINFVSNEEV